MNAIRGCAAALFLAACQGTPPAPVVTEPPVQPTFFPTEDPQVGTGLITFGLDYDDETLRITSPQTRFRTTNQGIAWSASLSDRAGATSLTLTISRKEGGGETIVLREDVDIGDPEFDTFANEVDLAAILDRRPGTYVMRYLREGEKLAEGSFTLFRP